MNDRRVTVSTGFSSLRPHWLNYPPQLLIFTQVVFMCGRLGRNKDCKIKTAATISEVELVTMASEQIHVYVFR